MKNHRSLFTALNIIWFLWDVKEPTLFKKSRGCRPRWCGQPSHNTTYHSHHGLGGQSKLKMDCERLPVVPLYADIQAYYSHVNISCKEGASVVLSCMTPSFLVILVTELSHYPSHPSHPSHLSYLISLVILVSPIALVTQVSLLNLTIPVIVIIIFS